MMFRYIYIYMAGQRRPVALSSLYIPICALWGKEKGEWGITVRPPIILSFFFYEAAVLWAMALKSPAALVLCWDGFQCGSCGAEFKTRAELNQHQVSQSVSHQHASVLPLFSSLFSWKLPLSSWFSILPPFWFTLLVLPSSCVINHTSWFMVPSNTMLHEPFIFPVMIYGCCTYLPHGSWVLLPSWFMHEASSLLHDLQVIPASGFMFSSSTMAHESSLHCGPWVFPPPWSMSPPSIMVHESSLHHGPWVFPPSWSMGPPSIMVHETSIHPSWPIRHPSIMFHETFTSIHHGPWSSIP